MTPDMTTTFQASYLPRLKNLLVIRRSYVVFLLGELGFLFPSILVSLTEKYLYQCEICRSSSSKSFKRVHQMIKYLNCCFKRKKP